MDDDASAATETCDSVSICDSEVPAEPMLHSGGYSAGASAQAVPLPALTRSNSCLSSAPGAAPGRRVDAATSAPV